MSSTGPPPARKRNRGSGCHRSASLCPTNMDTPTGSPISPSSSARRAVWLALPRNVSGAEPRTRPVAAAAASTSRAAGTVVARGFST